MKFLNYFIKKMNFMNLLKKIELFYIKPKS